jgi:hypothetical protein
MHSFASFAYFTGVRAAVVEMQMLTQEITVLLLHLTVKPTVGNF